MAYLGRPGVSPVVATLVGIDWIRPGDRILDVGCGTGTEALLLAEWGFRKVDAVDADPEAIRIAKGRATRKRLNKRVRFACVDARDLKAYFPRTRFHVVLHTLVANNLHHEDVARHFAGIRDVMVPDGLLVVQERIIRSFENKSPGRLAALDGLREHFDLTPGVATHLPEGGVGGGEPATARVVVWFGKPRP